MILRELNLTKKLRVKMDYFVTTQIILLNIPVE